MSLMSPLSPAISAMVAVQLRCSRLGKAWGHVVLVMLLQAHGPWGLQGLGFRVGVALAGVPASLSEPGFKDVEGFGV